MTLSCAEMENMYRRDPYEKETSSLPQRRRTPSFSSSLLDSIYRSIDESSVGVDNTITTLTDYKETVIVQKQSLASSYRGEDKASSLGRAIMIENWREKKKESSYGSSSSSDSCSSAVFSSSEESNFRGKSRKTTTPVMPTRCLMFDRRETGEKEKLSEGNFTKTKLKALKLYSELKKVKQPISPGGRISSFLNSIFNGNAKKMCSAGGIDDVSYERKSKSACSSATSFSRSCLSKSSSKKANRKKNSVKFYPVSIIVDEDCRPCGHKSIYEKDPSLMPRSTPSSSVHPKSIKKTTLKEELRNFSMEKHYQRKISPREFHYNYKDEDEEDDDDASCSSSDLFELDHLIGIGRYREELPVYETTNLKKNQAIANGFMI